MGASQTYNGTTTSTVITAATAINNIWDGGGSISFWVNPASDGELSNGRFVNKNSTNDGVPDAWIIYGPNESLGTMDIRFYHAFSTADGRWESNAGVITIGEWNHCCITYNSDSSANNPILYINGSSSTFTEAISPSGTRASDAAYDLYIGNSSTNARTLDGDICYVCLYDQILSAAEVNEIYHKGPGIAASLNGYWTMMDPIGTMVDRSGNGNNGILTNGTESFDGPPMRSA